MSEEEGFLRRWSRRKREAAREASAAAEGEGKSAAAPSPPAAPLDPTPSEAEALFDPASLPPIESIGAASDLKPFLAAGVPTEVMRAALRRAWTSDPAIRDFIGLSENSWDFNAPGSMGGFGPLSADEARRLLSEALGETHADMPESLQAQSGGSEQAASPVGDSLPAATGGAVEQATRDRAPACDAAAAGESNDNNGAMQHEAKAGKSPGLSPQRSHGGALPK